jgi:hypothetical protein
MAVRSCRVSIQDLEGITHTVEVTADSTFQTKLRNLSVSSVK